MSNEELKDERAAFESKFPVPGNLFWNGDKYIVRFGYVEDGYDEYVGKWAAWQARAAQPPAAEGVIRRLIQLRHNEDTRDHEIVAAIDALEKAIAAPTSSASERRVKLVRRSTGDVLQHPVSDKVGIADLLKEGWELASGTASERTAEVRKLCNSTGGETPCAYPTEINRQQAKRIAELEKRIAELEAVERAAEDAGGDEVAEWQARYVSDPRQHGAWNRVESPQWAQHVYRLPNHTDEHGWEVRPLFGRPAPANKAVGLTDEQRESVCVAIAEALGDALDCTRTWSAWGCGTMRESDFVSVAGDQERVAEIADAAINALLAAAQPSAKGEPQ